VITAVPDSELVRLGDEGRSRFYDLMFRRAEPVLYAFDLLMLDGHDLRDVPTSHRTQRPPAVSQP